MKNYFGWNDKQEFGEPVGLLIRDPVRVSILRNAKKH